MRKCLYCEKSYSDKLSCCPFCGNEESFQSSCSNAECPRCKKPLTLNRFRDTDIFECSVCNGIWLKTEDFDWLTQEREVYSDPTIPKKYTKPPVPDPEGYLPCAVCKKLMPRSNYKGASGVLIDTCRDHGVWLDFGELEKIRSYIASGKNTEKIEKLIHANAAQIRLLAKDVQDLSFMQKILHRFSLKRILFQD